MEIGIKKCDMNNINKGKFKTTDRVELPSGEKIRVIEED